MAVNSSCCDNARRMYEAAIDSVSPLAIVRKAVNYDHSHGVLSVEGVPYKLNKNVKVVAFGKAVLGMLTAIDEVIGEHVTEGVASIPVGSMDTARQLYPQCLPKVGSKIRIYEGAPGNLPDSRAELAAKEILSMAQAATADDIIIALISGGGSALLPCPVEGVSLQEKRQVIESLARGGATIRELNTFRKSLSRTKGGKLAIAAYPAKVVALILSDVVGDPLDTIASGPTTPHQTSGTEVLQLIEKYNLREETPASVLQYLQPGDMATPPASVLQYLQPGDMATPPASVLQYLQSGDMATPPALIPVENGSYSHVQNAIIGSNRIATSTASRTASQLGFDSCVWSHCIQGEARLLGEAYARIAHILLEHLASGNTTQDNELTEKLFTLFHEEPFVSLLKATPDLQKDLTSLFDRIAALNLPLCLISAGEPTVCVKGTGKGGRNQELVLSFALQIDKLLAERTQAQLATDMNVQCTCLSIGTDGQDGPCDAAGAIVDTSTIREAKEQGLCAEDYLDNNDSYTFFSALKGGRHLVQTGLTGTNVMDLQILLVK